MGIINHGKVVKVCELGYTINRDLSTFLGASETFLSSKLCILSGILLRKGHIVGVSEGVIRSSKPEEASSCWSFRRSHQEF
jgi:hypothetical protein